MLLYSVSPGQLWQHTKLTTEDEVIGVIVEVFGWLVLCKKCFTVSTHGQQKLNPDDVTSTGSTTTTSKLIF